MRYFDSILFCGAGQFSEADCALLRKQCGGAGCPASSGSRRT